jgi:hypothetical protein
MECAEMQAVDLAQKIMGLLDEAPSTVSINALDICRVLMREKDFNAISSQRFLSESPQETSQFERELGLVAAETASS